MYPCSACWRHLRDEDAVCPFCGITQRNEAAPVSAFGTIALAAMTLLGSSACAPRTAAEGDTTTMIGESAGSESTTTTSSSSTETSTMGDGDGDTTECVPNRDFAAYGSSCVPFWQDCPEGEKCVPYSSVGEEVFDFRKCVPVMGEGLPGEPCTYGGFVEATDDCNASSYCYYVEQVDGQLQGVCTPFCQGTFEEPICGPGTGCYIESDLNHFCIDVPWLAQCLPTCDPLLQDCAAGQMCSWTSKTNSFLCVPQPDAPPASGEPCEDYVSACGPGQLCVSADVLPACVGEQCCTEYCTLADPEFVCSDPELSCEPMFAGDMLPPGWELIGVCATATPPD